MRPAPARYVFTGLARHAVEAAGECRRVVLDGNVMADLGKKSPERTPAASLGGARETVLGDNSIER